MNYPPQKHNRKDTKMRKSRRAGTRIQQKQTPKPVPLASDEKLYAPILKEKRGKGHRPDEEPAPIRSTQEREDALRSSARVVSVEPMLHSSRLSPAPARKDGDAGGQT